MENYSYVAEIPKFKDKNIVARVGKNIARKYKIHKSFKKYENQLSEIEARKAGEVFNECTSVLPIQGAMINSLKGSCSN